MLLKAIQWHKDQTMFLLKSNYSQLSNSMEAVTSTILSFGRTLLPPNPLKPILLPHLNLSRLFRLLGAVKMHLKRNSMPLYWESRAVAGAGWSNLTMRTDVSELS